MITLRSVDELAKVPAGAILPILGFTKFQHDRADFLWSKRVSRLITVYATDPLMRPWVGHERLTFIGGAIEILPEYCELVWGTQSLSDLVKAIRDPQAWFRRRVGGDFRGGSHDNGVRRLTKSMIGAYHNIKESYARY